MRRLLFIVAFTAILASCKKDKAADSSVEIYELQNYSLLPGKCMIDPSSAIIQSVPTVKNEDIIEYSKSGYQFKLTGISYQKIKAFADLTPFAVAVNRNIIYYGIYKKVTSSSSCDHSIIMTTFYTVEQKIDLNLGYPFGMTGIDDQRNNPVLLAALKEQGKLR